ncbi:hypothetical protein BDV32DRAFT_12917 [Aspergillus pseudonomiae]|nr:hypothetical protein BDV32DRAFT_12917 [Aspergillus pseudonomiae]
MRLRDAGANRKWYGLKHCYPSDGAHRTSDCAPFVRRCWLSVISPLEQASADQVGTAKWLIDDDQAYELVGTFWNTCMWVIVKLAYLQLIVFYCVCIVLARRGVDWAVWDCLGSMGCLGGNVSSCGSFLGVLCFLMHCSGQDWDHLVCSGLLNGLMGF